MDRADLCLHELFEEQARRTPDITALEDPDTSLTYVELDRRADLLASYLRKIGVGPDEPIGVYMERRAEYVVACLAVMKAGGAYLTLELAYPPQLLAEVLDDAAPRVILTQERYAERLPEAVDRLCLDGDWAEGLTFGSSEYDKAEVCQEDLAFVSYSSGTTGKPKGIANPHGAPVRSYLWRFGISDYAPGDRVGCNVFFIWEMMRPLLRGATTVVIPDDVIYDPRSLLRFLEEYGVTETLITPSLLEAVLDASGPKVGERLSKLRTLWLNGEIVTWTLARRATRLLPAARLLNVYSCSETHEVAAGDLRELAENPGSTHCPVGRPMDPERTYILDTNGRLLPEGEAGELFVGGDCLARGYVNMPEKTRESFPDDPFTPESGARMYRTGDKARILDDGSLEILGRVDFMVKIRGYSVELGAVEAAIERNLAVRACVVVSEGEEGEDKRLIAYLVPDPEDGGRFSGWSLDPKTGRCREIRRVLQQDLPHYAVPAVFVELKSLPIQVTSGKVDRAALPPPPLRPARATPDGMTPVTLPAEATRSEKEDALARVWEEVLRLEEGEVGVEDDFFDLGGHSLAAAQLSGRIEVGFGVHVSMPLFMEDPTLGGLCDRIEALQSGESSAEARPPDLRAEAALDPDIVPEFTAAGARTPHEARSVFLTGATGFLGAFLLHELLSTTGTTVRCLVRPRGDDPPVKAIETNLHHYGIWRSGWAARIEPVAGDLSEPLLGMNEEDFDSLAREVEVVIHAGAVVNLVYPYSALRAANVGGTREVLRLACRYKAKPVHYVSTNGVFPPGAGLCKEDTDLNALTEAREDGYGQSKWVSERLVWEAAQRGLPVSVYRPGNVSGHSTSGVSNPRDLLGAILVGSLRLGCAPEVDGWRLEMTPVDFVAQAILDLASDPRTLGGIYHLANPDPPPAEEVFDRLEELGYPLDFLPYEEWLDAANASRREDDPVGDVLSGAAPAVEELWDDNVYDDRNARRVLSEGRLQRPAIDAGLLETYARYFAERGWVEAPESLHETGRRRPSRGATRSQLGRRADSVSRR